MANTPIPRQKYEATRLLIEGGMSIRQACLKVGISRNTYAKYHNKVFRVKKKRCPCCGHIVNWPCLQCTLTGELQELQSWLAEQRS